MSTFYFGTEWVKDLKPEHMVNLRSHRRWRIHFQCPCPIGPLCWWQGWNATSSNYCLSSCPLNRWRVLQRSCVLMFRCRQNVTTPKCYREDASFYWLDEELTTLIITYRCTKSHSNENNDHWHCTLEFVYFLHALLSELPSFYKHFLDIVVILHHVSILLTTTLKLVMKQHYRL